MDEKERQEVTERIMAVIAETAVSVPGVSRLSSTFTETIADNLAAGFVKSRTRGVRLDQKDGSIQADIYLNAEYGRSIPELAWNVQTAVNEKIRENFSIQLKTINVHVQGVERPAK